MGVTVRFEHLEKMHKPRGYTSMYVLNGLLYWPGVRLAAIASGTRSGKLHKLPRVDFISVPIGVS